METAKIGTAEVNTVERLTMAATVAALAPSIHNTQPWHWRIDGDAADLYIDSTRQLKVIDPDLRLATVSCGAALHHARVALAADGLAVAVSLLPTAGDRTHLARITVTGRTTATDADMRLYQTIRIRHTDRRPLTDEAIADSDLAALRRIAGEYATGLHPISRDDLLDLAAATSRAQHDEVDDIATRHELDAWTGDGRPAGAGIPDANILAAPAQTTVPSRDFGHAGSVPVADGHDHAAAYALVYGLDDEPGSWIRVGEALSAMWLYATEHTIALLPLSAAVEEPFTRHTLHRTLAGLGYAHLSVRLGIADPNQPATPRAPRLPEAETITVIS
jgi:nitroreductase